MALGSDKDIRIRLVLDAEGAIKSFQQLDGQMEDIKKTSSRAGEGFSKLEADVVSLNSALDLAGKAFNFAKGAVTEAFAAIERGAAVGDLNEGFNKAAKSAGVLGDVLLNQLNEATGGTISNFDLMKDAVESMRAGIKPDELVTMTKAARALAEETGGNLNQELADLQRAFETGNVRVLQNKLGIIDLEKAENKLAAQYGKTRTELSKEGQVLAARQALLEASIKKTEEFGEVTNDAGDNIASFGKTLTDAFDKAKQALAEDAGLNAALGDLSQAVKEVDWSVLVEGARQAAEVVTFFINAASSAVEMAGKLKNALDTGIGAAVGGIQSAFGSSAADKTRQIQPLLDAYFAKNQPKGSLNSLFTADPIKIYMDSLEQAASRGDKGIIGEALFGGGSKKESKSAIDLLDEYKGKTEKLFSLYRDGFIDITRLDTELTGLGNSFSREGGSASEFSNALDRISQQNLDSVSEGITKVNKEFKQTTVSFEEDLGNAINNVFDTGFTGKQIGTVTSEFVSSAIPIVLDGVKKGFNRDTAKEILVLAGSVIGAAFGGPLGATIGGAAGSLLGPLTEIGTSAKANREALIPFEAFGFSIPTISTLIKKKLFQDDSEGTAQRKSVDKYFADLFDANRIQVIIDGQLTQLEDFQFTGMAEQVFAPMSDSVNNSFQGIGTALEEQFGIAHDLGVNLGNVLANNLGGSLNNLQLLVDAMGISFEQLGEQITKAFLDGDVTAQQALQALQGIEKAAQKGIPDGLGLTAQAFQNIKDAGVKGGRALIDALQDVGFEAKELGINTFPALMANLAQSGQFTQEEIQQVFSALAENGIDSIEELTSATTEQLIPVLAQLESSGFDFSEASDRAAELAENLSKLPEEKNVTINVKTNFDSNTQQAINQGVFNGNYGDRSVSA